jgi:hypothetical protein
MGVAFPLYTLDFPTISFSTRIFGMDCHHAQCTKKSLVLTCFSSRVITHAMATGGLDTRGNGVTGTDELFAEWQPLHLSMLLCNFGLHMEDTLLFDAFVDV